MRAFAFAFLAVMLGAAGAAQAQTADCPQHITPPEPIMATHTVPPWPPLSQQLEETGATLLQVTIAADGSVSDASVAESSGSLRLDDAAIAHVKENYRWKPATVDCKAVAVKTQLRIVWDLRKAPEQPTPVIEIVLGPDDYPAEAKAKQMQGALMISCMVSETGTLAMSVVTQGSGFQILDDKALEILRTRYKWTPAQMSGKPVKTVLVFAIRWSLQP